MSSLPKGPSSFKSSLFIRIESPSNSDNDRVRAFYEKYSAYNKEFELRRNSFPPICDHKYLIGYDPGGSPQLLDALSTGCSLPCAKSSYDEFTSQIEYDIMDIVELDPSNLNCRLGSLRCISGIPPLYMAYVNKNIPLPLVEFLLKKSSSCEEKSLFNYQSPCVLDALQHPSIANTTRSKEIEELVVRQIVQDTIHLKKRDNPNEMVISLGEHGGGASIAMSELICEYIGVKK